LYSFVSIELMWNNTVACNVVGSYVHVFPLVCYFIRDVDTYSMFLWCWHFYHAMHYSAKCGLAIACRLSVRLWRWFVM